MANYFYFDQFNQKQGPVSGQQLKELASQGIIGPQTPIATDTGHKGTAGQIPDLFPPKPVPPFELQMPAIQAGFLTWLFGWLLDFKFRNIQIHTVIRWICIIWYVICWIVLALYLVIGTLGLLATANHEGLVWLLLIPLLWIAIAFGLVFDRLLLELCVIGLDWIVTTTKAARIYIENNKKE